MGDTKGDTALHLHEPSRLPHCWICKQSRFFNSPPSALEEALVPVRAFAVLCMQKVGFSRNEPFGICYAISCGGEGSETTKTELHSGLEPYLPP